jgi:hypothetical protein
MKLHLPLQNRPRLLGLLAIAAVVLLAGDRLVLTPLVRGWKERATRIAEFKKFVAQGELLLERERAIRARWDSMRTNTLADEVSVAEHQMLYAFEHWAQDSRIGVSDLRPQWKRAAEDHALLECRLIAFGSLSSLTRFLYNLEKDPLALRVEGVEITTRDDRGEQLTLGLQVSGLLLNPRDMP